MKDYYVFIYDIVLAEQFVSFNKSLKASPYKNVIIRHGNIVCMWGVIEKYAHGKTT